MSNNRLDVLPVLIVGAGTVGHVLALVLLQNKIPIRVIDRDSRYRVGQRGAGVFTRTVEMHRILGTLDDYMRYSSDPPLNRLHAKGEKEKFIKEFLFLEAQEPTPSNPYSQAKFCGQDLHDAFLRNHVEQLGGRIELSTTLKSFKQFPDYVSARLVKISSTGEEAEEEVKAHYLIGTDGGKSSVRKEAGLTFLGESKVQDRFVLGDFHIKGLDPSIWHMWGDAQSQSFLARPIATDSDVFNVIGFGRDLDNDALAASREAFIKGFCSATGLNEDLEHGIQFGDIVWFGKFEPNIRMVDAFRTGRVLLAGDAAHTHSPTGGQGMNTGVVDAMNLGWKLALVLKSLASPTLLDSYNDERLPVIASMLNKTTLLHNKTFTPASDPTAAFRRGHELHQLGVNYRSSGILVDETSNPEGTQLTTDPYRDGEDGQVRAGDRAPDAPGLVDLRTKDKSRNVFDFFKTTHHTIFVFSPSQELSSKCFSKLDAFFPSEKRFLFQKVVVIPKGSSARFEAGGLGSEVTVMEDAEGHAYAGYNIEAKDLPVVIVRPDGWIGATVRDERGVQEYLERIFLK